MTTKARPAMFAELQPLRTITPVQLDTYLKNGWFRMRQSIFTTHFLCFQNRFFSAIWLRVNLQNQVDDGKLKELRKRNRFFTVQFKKAGITPAHETLYQQYRQSLSFQPSDSLQQLLLGLENHNCFNTWEISICDGKKLIAAGYFDVGQTSAAGIVSYYHPDYKKHSLGKFLIYEKMAFCREQQLSYFYPGYAAPGYALFDYKLTMEKASLEYFSLPEQQWLAYTPEELQQTPLRVMEQQLSQMQRYLQESGYHSRVFYYRFFDAALDPYFLGYRLFDYPVFIYCYFPGNEDVFRVIVYDVQKEVYVLMDCYSLSPMEYGESDDRIFSAELLEINKCITETGNPQVLADYL